MKTLILLYLLFINFLTSPTWGLGHEWLCTEEASQRKGNSIYSCGVGEGEDENSARSKAFDNAKSEFLKICDSSDDCTGRTVSVHPQRTACEKLERYRCYRLIVFVVGEKIKNAYPSSVTSAITSPDNQDHFHPFTYSSTSHLPKIKYGMTKPEVFKAFGVPREIVTNRDTQIAKFKGTMCVGEKVHGLNTCWVQFLNETVKSYGSFDPIYTEDLK